MKIIYTILLAFLFPFAGNIAKAENVTLYVSPTGKDTFKGTSEHPLRTVERALQLAREHIGKKKVDIVFKDGTYYLDHSLQIDSRYSATEQHPLTFKAEHVGKAIWSGGELLDVVWKEWRKGIYTTKLPVEVRVIDQLYINGEAQRMARYPNAVAGKNVFDTWNLKEKSEKYLNPLSAVCVSKWKNPTGAYLHTMHQSLWGDVHWRVTGKENDTTLCLEGGWQNNRYTRMHPVYRMIENVFEELNAPGEWYFDASKGLLYYYPQEGTDLNQAKVEIVRLENLVHVAGDKDKPVKHVQFEGLLFRHTARTFMKNREPLLRSDWTVYRNGTILMEGAEHCVIKDCEFDQVGGNTIVVSNYNKGIRIQSCYIHDSGANGIVFVGNPDMVRSPLFKYGKQDYARMDRTPGPKGWDFPQECRVEDCLITRTGRHEKQTAPIQISMSYRITVSHCSIYEVPRAGINISEGTFGGHVIEYCDVFDTVLETGDHGSFNSWGRDRFWTPDIKETADEVAKDTILPYLDMLEKNVIRNSRWRCDYGWDIDLDDGSSFYHIYNNVLLNGGLKLREGYHRIVENNLVLNNSLHPHVWYYNSSDIVTGNIFWTDYHPVLMDKSITADGKWGQLIDYNFFLRESDRKANIPNGCDTHSVVFEPTFADPSCGDYTLDANSEALRKGFKNIDMNFGVVSGRLRALARVPRFPDIARLDGQEHKGGKTEWQGVTVKGLETLGEQSAVGYKDLCGVLVLSVRNDSFWHSQLSAGDLLIECNGQKVCNVADLKKAASPAVRSIKIWRNQQEIVIK